MRKYSFLLCLILFSLLQGYSSEVSGQAAVSRVGLVVQYADQSISTHCLEFEGESINGYDALLLSGLPLEVSFDGMGSAICKIGPDGCSSDQCFCQFPPNYWTYWHLEGDSWQYSQQGASSYQVQAGSVEGWSWGAGVAPTVVSFQQICTPEVEASATATLTPTATPTETVTPQPTASRTPKPETDDSSTDEESPTLSSIQEPLSTKQDNESILLPRYAPDVPYLLLLPYVRLDPSLSTPEVVPSPSATLHQTPPSPALTPSQTARSSTGTSTPDPGVTSHRSRNFPPMYFGFFFIVVFLVGILFAFFILSMRRRNEE